MSSETASTFIPYTRHDLDEHDIRAVVEALRSSHVTQGPRIEAFEDALRRTTGASHAVAVSSGTAALQLAYAAVGLGAGDEIVVSPNTFLATASAAVMLGARPVFADIEPLRFNVDPRRVEAAITGRTRAIVAVDFAGHPCEMEELRTVADRHGVRLIADGCHSLGASYHGRSVGTLADLTTVSFHPAKAITTGEGGAVLTGDAELARRCRLMRSHGMERDPQRQERNDGPWYYEVQSPGWNFRITDFQSALGIRQLERLDGFIERRRALAGRYGRLLHRLAGVELPSEAAGVRSAWHLYVVRVQAERRRRVFEGLRRAGIGVQVHYIPLYRQPFYRRLLGVEAGAFPVTEAYYAGAISLPLFPALIEADQDRVVDVLRRLCDGRDGF